MRVHWDNVRARLNRHSAYSIGLAKAKPSVRASHTFLFVRAKTICLFLNRDVIQLKPGKAPGTRRETITTMTRKRSGILGLLFLVVVGLAATGLFVAQQRYIRYHLPLIKAQLTNAEAEGPEMLERIGVPAGSTVISAVNRAIYSSGSTRRSPSSRPV